MFAGRLCKLSVSSLFILQYYITLLLEQCQALFTLFLELF
nr:MAG TPA: hypothetical protein [Caudoviricetes sp.]